MKNANTPKRTTKILFCVGIFLLSLFLFVTSQFYRTELVIFYKNFVYGKSFELNDARYKVSEEFVIFDKKVDSIYLARFSNRTPLIVDVREFNSNQYKAVTESSDYTITDLEQDCAVYSSPSFKDGFTNFFWSNNEKTILVGALIHDTDIQDISFCGMVTLQNNQAESSSR